MNNPVEWYMKKLSNTTKFTPLEDIDNPLEDMIDAMKRDTPYLSRSKSSFKEVNKKMEEIEDGAKKE